MFHSLYQISDTGFFFLCQSRQIQSGRSLQAQKIICADVKKLCNLNEDIIRGKPKSIFVGADNRFCQIQFFCQVCLGHIKTEFGSTKVAFDVSLTVIAGVLSFLFAHRLDGVREGTIIAALLVGFIARLFGRRLSFLEPLLFSKKQQAAGENAGETAVEESAAAKRPVIVIGRQYGSGGHSGNYDLTIDTEMGAETVQEIICRTLELRQKQQ